MNSSRASDQKVQAKEYVNSQFPDLFKLLKEIVNINTHCSNVEGVNKVQDIIAKELKDCGMNIEYFEMEGRPKALIAKSPACKQKNLVLSLHADTVYFPDSDFTTLEDAGDRFIGPGVYDLKGSIITMIAVIRTIKQLDLLDKLPICVLITPDEEVVSTVGQKVIAKLAPEIAVAVVMEFARENNNILIDRYGVGTYKITVKGKSAHSGNGFDKGANAFAQLGYTASKLWALSDISKYTFNVTNPKCGEQLNIIPDYASCESDLRLASMSYLPEIEEHIKKLEQDIIVPGTTVSIEQVRLEAPVEETEESLVLLDSLLKCAHEAGFKSTRSETSRGASDGNIFAAHGITTADGLGPSGGKPHVAGEEWVDKSSFAPKAETLVYWFIDQYENPLFHK